MKTTDIIKLGVTPLADYEMEPDQVYPNGEWVLDPVTNKYIRSALVRDFIGSKINMRRHPVTRFSVQVFATPNGSGTVSGGGEYNPGETATIGAVANTGFVFVQWSDGDTNPQRNVEVNGDMIFIAIFEPEQTMYTINVDVNPECLEYGTVEGGGIFPYGTDIDIVAYPNEHCEFVKWNDGVTDSTRRITVTHDASYSAIFKVKLYNIEVVAEPPTYGIVIGSDRYRYGDIVTLRAIANPGYEFDRWSDNSHDPIHNIQVTNDAVYTAHFIRPLPTTATIIIRSNNSSWGSTIPRGTNTHNIGDVLTISATPREGYRFSHWEGSGAASMVDPTMAQYTFEVTGNAEFNAIFEQNTTPSTTHTVTVRVDPSGVGNMFKWAGERDGYEEGSEEFADGTLCALVAVPASGYQFDGWWQGNNQLSTDLAYVFQVTGDITLDAKFSIETPSERSRVIVGASPTQGGQVSGGGLYAYDEPCTVRAIPNIGYVFDDWVASNQRLDKSAAYTFPVIGESRLTALFNPIIYDFDSSCEDTSHNVVSDRGEIDVNVIGGGLGTIDDAFRITITPYTGYELAGLKINNSQVRTDESLVYDFNIRAYAESSSNNTISVVAIFAEESTT